MSKPVATSLVDQPVQASDAERARAFWLVKKYTSLTYIRRMSAIFANFVGGYEDFSRRSKDRVDFHRENLASFYSYRALLKEGIGRLEAGYTVGYASVLQGCSFAEYIGGRRFEFGLENEEIGFVWNGPPTGLYAWADVATKMAARISKTISSAWAFPAILESASAVALPRDIVSSLRASGERVYTNANLLTSGIWLPTTTHPGCPNYICTTDHAPTAARAAKRLDYPASPGEHGIDPPRRTFLYDEEATLWELVWVDRRYEGGKAPSPEETSFLGPDTEPPPWPPEQPMPS
jgi:hypothetical protein